MLKKPGKRLGSGGGNEDQKRVLQRFGMCYSGLRASIAVQLSDFLTPYWHWLFLTLGLWLITRGRMEEVVFRSAQTLKKGAREIKRRFPNSEFVKVPNDRSRWSAQPGEELNESQRLAISWHDQFTSYTRYIGLQDSYPTGDFDAVMASLDADEIESRSIRLLCRLRGWRLLMPRSGPARRALLVSPQVDRRGDNA